MTTRLKLRTADDPSIRQEAVPFMLELVGLQTVRMNDFENPF